MARLLGNLARWKEMERRKYCVYNQTSESFLSFGVTVADNIFARLKGIIGKRAASMDEGLWIVRPNVVHTFGVFSARDLVYLDEEYRVLQVVESFPTFRIADLIADAASVLELPVHTIYSSHTQPGNQLVICVAEEMEFRLQSSANAQPPEDVMKTEDLEGEMETANLPKGWLSQRLFRDRRRASREQWPGLVDYDAYDSTGTALAVHGIRDISSTGLYLLTKERWPIGSLVMMTLQRTDGSDDNSKRSISVQMRVIRWASDGVGLLFVQPVAEQARQMAATGR